MNVSLPFGLNIFLFGNIYRYKDNTQGCKWQVWKHHFYIQILDISVHTSLLSASDFFLLVFSSSGFISSLFHRVSRRHLSIDTTAIVSILFLCTRSIIWFLRINEKYNTFEIHFQRCFLSLYTRFFSIQLKIEEFAE